jgi:hypothetical protein
LGAKRQRTSLQSAVDFGVGFHDGLDGPAAHIGLEAHVSRDYVHLHPSLGNDGMDADGIMFPEGLAHRINRHQGDVGGVQSIDSHMRRAASMRRLTDVTDGFHHTAIIGHAHTGQLVLGTGSSVNHHR